MKRMTVKPAAIAALAAVIAALSPAGATMPVFDYVAAVNFLKSLAEMKEQLATAKSQLAEAQRMYQSVTGSRGFGDLLRDGQFEQYLPQDARALYDGSGGGAGITGLIEDVLRQEQTGLTGTVPEMEGRVRERQRRLVATNKALNIRALDGVNARLAEIESLMDQIGQTQDQKALGELQARLAGEQAAIANENAKLQLLAGLQAAEEKLIEEQKREISRRILDPANQGMPSIR